MPDWTRMVRSPKLISRTLFILPTPRTIASSCGIAPPASDVPAPLGTTFTPFSLQKARIAATSSVVVGRTTASGMRRYDVSASVSNARRSSSLVINDSGGIRAESPEIMASRRKIMALSGIGKAIPIILLQFGKVDILATLPISSRLS